MKLKIALCAVAIIAGLFAMQDGLRDIFSPSASAQGPTAAEIRTEIDSAEKNLDTYKSDTHGFQIDYPSGWEKEEIASGPIVFKFKHFNGLVSARVATEPLAEGTDLDTYDKASLEMLTKGMADNKIVIKVVEQSEGQLCGLPARKTIYSYTLPDIPNASVKVMQILTLKDTKGYLFNYTASDSLYDSFLALMERIAGSMKLI